MARPNPSRETTTLAFSLARAGWVEVGVFGVDGRRVKTLLRAAMEPGFYDVQWNGADAAGRPVSAGVYFVRMLSSEGRLTRTLVRLR